MRLARPWLAVSETAIPHDVKRGDVVTTSQTSGFGLVTAEYKCLGFAVWVFGGQDNVRSLWLHIYHGTNGLIYVDQQQRSKPGRGCQ